jgi:hypothetical protein
MAFEQLFNQPNSELDLLNQVAEILKSEFARLEDTYYFLKLSNCGDGQSEIIWEKSYDNLYDLGVFIWDSPNWRASILVRFENDHFVTDCFGFSFSHTILVWPDRIKKYPYEKCTRNREERPMPTREQIEGIADLAGEVQRSKKIAV